MRARGGEGRELGQEEDGWVRGGDGWWLKGLALQGRPEVCELAGTRAYLNGDRRGPWRSHQRRGPQRVGPGSPGGPLPCLATPRGGGGGSVGCPRPPASWDSGRASFGSLRSALDQSKRNGVYSDPVSSRREGPQP